MHEHAAKLARKGRASAGQRKPPFLRQLLGMHAVELSGTVALPGGPVTFGRGPSNLGQAVPGILGRRSQELWAGCPGIWAGCPGIWAGGL